MKDLLDLFLLLKSCFSSVSMEGGNLTPKEESKLAPAKKASVILQHLLGFCCKRLAPIKFHLMMAEMWAHLCLDIWTIKWRESMISYLISRRKGCSDIMCTRCNAQCRDPEIKQNGGPLVNGSRVFSL